MLPGIKRCVVSYVVTKVAENVLPLYTEHHNIKTSELSILLYLLLARQEIIKQKQFYHDYKKKLQSLKDNMYLHEDQNSSMIISRSVPRRMRNI